MRFNVITCTMSKTVPWKRQFDVWLTEYCIIFIWLMFGGLNTSNTFWSNNLEIGSDIKTWTMLSQVPVRFQRQVVWSLINGWLQHSIWQLIWPMFHWYNTSTHIFVYYIATSDGLQQATWTIALLTFYVFAT